MTSLHVRVKEASDHLGFLIILNTHPMNLFPIILLCKPVHGHCCQPACVQTTGVSITTPLDSHGFLDCHSQRQVTKSRLISQMSTVSIFTSPCCGYNYKSSDWTLRILFVFRGSSNTLSRPLGCVFPRSGITIRVFSWQLNPKPCLLNLVNYL